MGELYEREKAISIALQENLPIYKVVGGGDAKKINCVRNNFFAFDLAKTKGGR